MNKQKFNQILTHENGLSNEDIANLDSLENKYPYSQAVHILSAAAHYKKNPTTAKSKLAIAAVYATDRTILKENVLNFTFDEKVKKLAEPPEAVENEKVIKKATVVKKAEPKQEKVTPVSDEPQIVAQPGRLNEKELKALRKELLNNLNELVVIKNGFFEVTPAKKSKITKKEATAKSTTASKKRPSAKPAKASKTTAVKKAITSKTGIKTDTKKVARTKSGSKAKPATKPAGKKATASSQRSKISKTIKSTPIRESKVSPSKKSASIKKTAASKKISSSKKEDNTLKSSTRASDQKKTAVTTSKVTEVSKTPAKNKSAKDSGKKSKVSQKEQTKIIEKFIKTKPRMPKPTKKNEPELSDDLSSRSVEFGDDLVSENLAKILIKQGKQDKAVEIYKKLIWKFPQKKAYFASQIKSLKDK